MKRFFQFLMASALVVSMQGCSNEPSFEPNSDSKVQLRLTGEINPTTRVNADGFEDNDKVGVYVATASKLNSAGNTLDNEAFTYSSGNIAAPQGKEVYWASDDVRLSVFAYYPYVTGAPKTGVVNFSVEANQSTSAKYYGSDFISAKSLNLAPQSSPVALTFNHLLSRLDVELVAGDGITQDELRAAEKSLLVGGLDMSGKVDIVAGTVVGDEQFGDVTPYKVDGDSYSFIAYPCDEKLSFRLEMDDELYSCSADIELKAGYKSKITITVDKYEPQTLSLSVVGINPWTDDATNYAATMDNFITFADAKFKEYLIGKNIDANQDEEISFAEAENVTRINVANLGITSMAELHYFPNLEYLSCSLNQLTALDVSKNTALKGLYCDNNQLTALDVSNNTALEDLSCYDNQLTALDVSKNTALIGLYCYSNQLTALDVSKNTALESLYCNFNQLRALDVSKNTALEELYCYSNQLTALDVSDNTALETFLCDNNQLTALDVSKNTALTTLSCSPMNDENGNNLLTTIYTYQGQTFTTLNKPDGAQLVVKAAN